MVQSIVSTFFGVCFPHNVVCEEDNDEVFIHLYEASSAYVFTKVLIMQFYRTCNNNYNQMKKVNLASKSLLL